MRGAAAALVAAVVATTAPAAPAPAPTSPRAPAAVEAVALFADRPAVQLDLAAPRAQRPETFLAAWVWSREAPPRRVAAHDLDAELARLVAGPEPQRLDRLRIRVPASVEQPHADLEAVAAPAAMFAEVPEAWLPRWPLARSGRVEVPREEGVRWRVRLIGRGRGSGWHDVEPLAAELLLSPVDAADRRIRLVDAEGGALPDSFLTLLEDSHGAPRPAVLAQQHADERGFVELLSLPPSSALTFVAGAPDAASRVLRGRPAELPDTLGLPAAARLLGRLIDVEGRPVSGATVSVEGWLDPEIPVRFRRGGESDDEGRWQVDALPPRAAVLFASVEGFAALRRSLELAEGERRELGTLTLDRGTHLAVSVVDERGVPVPGAVVAMPGRRASTGEDGLAALTDLAVDTDLALRVTATGFLASELVVEAPWPLQAVARLTRAFILRGRFAAADGLPLPGAAVRIDQARSFRYQDLAADGSFEIELPPHLDHSLRFASPAARERIVEVAAGLPGEERDLGQLVPPPGVGAWGALVSAVDGTPVVGARVWTPRPSEDALGSWLHGDLLETRSDELGSFELGGLEGRPELLRVDAAGFARLHVAVQPGPDDATIDLGTLELSPGATLRVVAGREGLAGAVARFDLRGEWMDLDMLTASFSEGAAEIPHVPAGEGVLTVLAGGELLCERRVAVTEDEDLEVECGGNAEVHGLVLAGERPAGPGALTWSSAADLPVRATIFSRSTPLGAAQQQVAGAGRPPVRVEVADDGTFASDRLAPGRWSVSWQPLDGLPAAPRAVEVPPGEGAHVVVRVDGDEVTGRILDEVGEPVAAAWVRELASGAVGRSDSSGSYRLTGLPAGEVRLQARHGDRFSEVTRLWLEDDRPPDPVDLVVADDHEGRLAVQVSGGDGSPAAGALVFVDTATRGLQVVSADGGGRAELVLAAPYPPRLRIAAFHDGRWGFSGWREWSRRAGVLEQEVDGSGEIVVASEEISGPVALIGPDGWDVSAALALLGSRTIVSPHRELRLGGLPDGLYHVVAGHAPPRPAALSRSRRSLRVDVE